MSIMGLKREKGSDPFTDPSDPSTPDNYQSNWPTRERAKGAKLTIPVNSVHWAQSVFPLLSDKTISAQDGGVNEAFEDPSRHFHMGIQWHPEYAQGGLTGQPGIVQEQHRRIMRALGDAGRDGRAARILQKAVRAWAIRVRRPL